MYPHSDFLVLATRIDRYFVHPARPVLLITVLPPPAPVPTPVLGPWDGVPYYVSPLFASSLFLFDHLKKLRWVITSFGGM